MHRLRSLLALALLFAAPALDVLWGRANLYLDLTRDMTSLGINDDAIAGFVYADANLEELRLVLP